MSSYRIPVPDDWLSIEAGDPTRSPHETRVAPRRPALPEITDSYQQRLKIKQILDRLVHEGPGISASIDIPRVVVIGSQSSGKSSLFEGISGVSLPRDTGTCTRCPIICQMTQSKGGRWRCKISLIREVATEGPDGEATTRVLFGEEIFDRQSVCDRIKRAQVAILHPEVDPDEFLGNYEYPRSKGFSSDAILVEITGPDVIDLSFVDLPGLIQMDEENSDNVRKIQQLVASYVENVSSLILLVYKCSDDTSNQGAGGMAKYYDAKGTRTITVLTMPDLVDPGQEGQWKNMIRTSRNSFCVRQPGFKQLATMTREAARKQEADFFQHKSGWKDLSNDPEIRQRLGTENLTEYLNARLLEWIVERLPVTLADVHRHIREIDSELTRLPAVITDPVKVTNKILWEFERKMSAAVDIHNFKIPELVATCRRRQEEFVDALFYHLYPRFWPLERKGGSKPNSTDPNSFPPILPKIETFEFEAPRGLPPPDVVYIDEVMMRSYIGRSKELPGNYPYGVLKEYMENSVDVWIDPTVSMVEDIVREIISALEPVVSEHFGSYTLEKRIWEEVRSHIESRGDRAQENLAYCITREKASSMVFGRSEFFHYKQAYLDHYMSVRTGDHDSYYSKDEEDGGGAPVIEALGSVARAATKAVVGAALGPVGQIVHAVGEEIFATTEHDGTDEGIAAGDVAPTKAKGFYSRKSRRSSDPGSLSPDEINAIDVMAQTRAFYHIAVRRFAEGAAQIVFHDLLIELQCGPELQQKLRDVIGMSGSDLVKNCQRFLEPSGEAVRRRDELVRARAVFKEVLTELNSFI
ncbi:hypothetical protein FRC17_002087 [Serendipita sp. 399]|nr:hypothetical protein FRC17_002087 [Serendipita sp. 399]